MPYQQQYDPNAPGYYPPQGQSQRPPTNSYQDQFRRFMEAMTGGGQQEYDYGRTRPGSPIGGQVGAPDLGTASELMRWARQVPNGEQILRNMGMMPEITQSQWSSGSAGPNNNLQTGLSSAGRTGNQTDWDLAQRNQQAAQQRSGRSQQQPQQQQYRPGYVPGYTPPIYGPGGGTSTIPAYGSGTMTPNGYSATAGYLGPQVGGGQSAGGFQGQLQNAVSGLLQNPSGLNQSQQNMMRTRATDAVAGQQSVNEQRTREDAIRRGASTSAGGDSDIRSELNRVGAQGASDQSKALTDIDALIANLNRTGTLGAINAGVGVQGEANKQRELEMLIGQLMQQAGGLGGLQLILGGK